MPPVGTVHLLDMPSKCDMSRWLSRTILQCKWQTAVTAYLESKQLMSCVFPRQNPWVRSFIRKLYKEHSHAWIMHQYDDLFLIKSAMTNMFQWILTDIARQMPLWAFHVTRMAFGKQKISANLVRKTIWNVAFIVWMSVNSWGFWSVLDTGSPSIPGG